MDILCLYYPEWHVYPEGEAIFGKGRTEWDYVDSAVPRFPGHEQPLQLLDGHPDDANRFDQDQFGESLYERGIGALAVRDIRFRHADTSKLQELRQQAFNPLKTFLDNE